MKRQTGTYETSTVTGEEVRAFLPAALPPSDPPLDLDALDAPLREASDKLRELELAGDMVPSIDWFVYAFVRKEAVLSSQIEGTESTFMDLLESEATGKATKDRDLEEVCCYLDAINFAWAELDSPTGLPLSMRLLSETHLRLLSSVRGRDKQPGEVRRSQNWIGGTRPGTASFVPAPPHRLQELLTEFEQAIHTESDLHPLLRTGLLHVQFETLHPYLDGNGRLGRLLIALLLKHWGLLSRPLLYLSLFLKSHQSEYYRGLGAVRTEGDWEGWLAFFLQGVAETAGDAAETARKLNSIVIGCRARAQAHQKATVLGLRLFELLPKHPIVGVRLASELLACSRPAATKALASLEAAEILFPFEDSQRGRTLSFEPYLKPLREGG